MPEAITNDKNTHSLRITQQQLMLKTKMNMMRREKYKRRDEHQHVHHSFTEADPARFSLTLSLSDSVTLTHTPSSLSIVTTPQTFIVVAPARKSCQTSASQVKHTVNRVFLRSWTAFSLTSYHNISSPVSTLSHLRFHPRKHLLKPWLDLSNCKFHPVPSIPVNSGSGKIGG